MTSLGYDQLAFSMPCTCLRPVDYLIIINSAICCSQTLGKNTVADYKTCALDPSEVEDLSEKNSTSVLLVRFIDSLHMISTTDEGC